LRTSATYRAATVAPRLLLLPLRAGAAAAPSLAAAAALLAFKKERERVTQRESVPVLKIRMRQSWRKRTGAEDICVVVVVVGPRARQGEEKQKKSTSKTLQRDSKIVRLLFFVSVLLNNQY
jgi:hypothetical protein